MLIILNVTRSTCFDCGGAVAATAVLRRCINLALNMFVCLFAGFCLMFLFSVLAQFFQLLLLEGEEQCRVVVCGTSGGCG